MSRRYHLFIRINIIFLVLITSCRNHNIIDYYKESKSFMHKQLLIPDTLDVYKSGINIKVDIFNTPYKIATYINGECSSCLKKLILWDDFIKTNCLNNRNVSVLFFINARDYDQIQFIIENANFNYPVIYDPDNIFYFYNSLSNNTHFQTFLVDSNNFVLAIGNPVISKSVANNYLKIITVAQ